MAFFAVCGIRKFDISHYQSKIKILDFDESLFMCIQDRKPLELRHFSKNIQHYYRFLVHSEKIADFTSEILLDIIHDQRQHHSKNEDLELLIRLLNEDFKNVVLDEYNKGVKMLENRNKFAEILNTTPQVFIRARIE